MLKQRRSLLLTVWILFCVTEVAAVVVSVFLSLTDQEAYYWSWSKLPGSSYYDHPPMQAWITAFLTALWGDHAWVVRLPAIGGRCAAIFLVYLVAKKIYNERVALLSALFAMGSFLLILGSVVAIPDVIATPLCLLAIYWTEDNRPKSAAVAIGLAVLAKWTSLFITPVLLYRFWKQGLSKTKLLFEIILLPVLIQTPVILWNVQYDFVTLKFHIMERQHHGIWPASKYVSNFINYLGSQIFAVGLAGIALFIFVLLAGWMAKEKVSTDFKRKSYQTLLWAIPGFFIVGISSLQGEFRFYWTNVSMLILEMILIAFVLEKRKDWEKHLTQWAIACLGVSWGLIFLTVLLPMGVYVNQWAGKKVYSRPSIMSDLTQWSSWVAKSMTEKDRNDPELALWTSDIHIGSQLAWSLGKENILRVRVAGAHPNQFGIWQLQYPKNYPRALFLADFRFENKHVFDGLCATPVQWHTDEIHDGEFKIGEIYWARCDQLLIKNESRVSE